jgi:CheY-like chemotaxis protein
MVPSILITDDDRSFRETLQGVLEPEGYHTILAGDGQEALGIVASCEVHLVLLDMHMPRLTGLDTVRLLRDRRKFIPCVLMSARADDDLVQQARREDVFSVLTKPVSRQVIMGTVRSALERAWGLR